MPSHASHAVKLLVARLLVVLFVVAALVLGWLHWQRSEHNPLSESAALQADVVHISTPVAGRLATLEVKEGARVEAGQRLFTLDDTSYRLQVDAARAQLRLAEATLASSQRHISAEQSNTEVANQEVARAQANLELARQSLARLQPLAAKGYVTAQQLDDARTMVRNAEVGLAQAQAGAQAATDLVSDPDAAQAAVDAQRAALAMAERALADTRVDAPHNGRIVGLQVSTGEYVAPDQSLFTLINTDHWYALAMFRETELGRIHDGMCATVYALAAPRTPLTGKVVNIGWGVSSEGLINLPRGLPYVPKSLDWVHVAQRFPVRVEIQNPPAELMRVGASASVRLHHDGNC